ncbi:MAG: hypothetical protein ACTSRK_09235 [Promethearchaeota archaeon]
MNISQIPQTIPGKNLYLSEGIELEFSQFIEVLKIKGSEIVIHVKSDNIVLIKGKPKNFNPFSHIENGIFILDNIPLMFTDDCGYDNFSELFLKLKDSLKKETTSDEVQHHHNDLPDNRLDLDLFRKIGDSIFGSKNVSQNSDSPQPKQPLDDDSDEESIKKSSMNEDVEELISLRRKIQLIENEINDSETSPKKKKELENQSTILREDILNIIKTRK